MAYATCNDVEAGWRTLTAEEQGRVTTLLDRAAVMLSALVDIDDEDEQQAAVLKVVSCNMVTRAMVTASSAAFGVDQQSATMGPFAQSVHFANPNGDMYLTKTERKMLGIGSGRGRVLTPQYGTDDEDE